MVSTSIKIVQQKTFIDLHIPKQNINLNQIKQPLYQQQLDTLKEIDKAIINYLFIYMLQQDGVQNLKKQLIQTIIHKKEMIQNSEIFQLEIDFSNKIIIFINEGIFNVEQYQSNCNKISLSQFKSGDFGFLDLIKLLFQKDFIENDPPVLIFNGIRFLNNLQKLKLTINRNYKIESLPKQYLSTLSGQTIGKIQQRNQNIVGFFVKEALLNLIQLEEFEIVIDFYNFEIYELDAIFQGIQSLLNLKSLSLKFIPYFYKKNEIDYKTTQSLGKALSCLRNLTQLKLILEFQNFLHPKLIFEGIRKIPNLEELYLQFHYYFQFSDMDTIYLRDCLMNISKLKQLYLNIQKNSEMRDNSGFVELSKAFSSLQCLLTLDLSLSNKNLSERCMESLSQSISKLRMLQEFKIYIKDLIDLTCLEAQHFGECLQYLTNLINLKISIYSYDKIGRGLSLGLQKSFQKLSKLESFKLKMNYNNNFLEEGFLILYCSLKYVRTSLKVLKLSLGDSYNQVLNQQINIQQMQDFIYFENLKTLSIKFNFEISKENDLNQQFLELITPSLLSSRQLNNLNIVNNFTNINFEKLGNDISQLTQLKFLRINFSSSDAIYQLFNGIIQLQNLQILQIHLSLDSVMFEQIIDILISYLKSLSNLQIFLIFNQNYFSHYFKAHQISEIATLQKIQFFKMMSQNQPNFALILKKKMKRLVHFILF